MGPASRHCGHPKGVGVQANPPLYKVVARPRLGSSQGLEASQPLSSSGSQKPPCRLSKKLHVTQQRCYRVREMRQQEAKRDRSCDLGSHTLTHVRTLTSSHAHSHTLTCTFTHAHTHSRAHSHTYTLTHSHSQCTLTCTFTRTHSHMLTHPVTHCHTLTLRNAGGTCLARPPRSSPAPSFQCHTWQVFRCLDPEQVLGPPLHCHLHLNRMAQEPQGH